MTLAYDVVDLVGEHSTECAAPQDSLFWDRPELNRRPNERPERGTIDVNKRQNMPVHFLNGRDHLAVANGGVLAKTVSPKAACIRTCRTS